MLSKYPLQNQDNPARVIDGETVIVTPDDSQLHTINGTGTYIWERSDGRHRLEMIVEELVAEYDIDRELAERDAVEFVQACVEKKVLLLSSEPISDSVER